MTEDLSKWRNIGIAAHIDAGKTTTTERVLFYTGKTHRAGDVDDGNTITDFYEEEQRRGITIYSAAVSCPWNGYTINLIDTPGHVDFTAEVERSLRVLDGAVVVFDAKEGVEAQSETVWRQCDRYDVPRICFMNKMDKTGADFEAAFDSIRKRLNAHPVAVQIPIGASDDFIGLVDLISMEALEFKPDTQGTKVCVTEIPDHLRGKAEEWRHKMLEEVAGFSDALMEKYVGDQAISSDEIRQALRSGTITGQLHPVLCGSSLRYIGTRKMLDAVCDFLPSPLDVPAVEGHDPNDESNKIELRPDPEGLFAGLVFKIIAERPVDLFFVRIYSGTLHSGTRVYNPTKRKKENISRIYRVFAKRREQLDCAVAGDIVAVAGLKESLTGHTLCDAKNQVVLETISFPDCVLSRAIEPSSASEREKLAYALQQLGRQDPTFRASTDPETGQALISGMGELHLEVILHRLQKEMNIGVNVGQPRVAYRETIRQRGEADVTFKKQTGGRGQFARVKLAVEPIRDREKMDSLEFESIIVGGAVPREYLRAVESGFRDAAKSGPLSGNPLTGVVCTLMDGAAHTVDSSELAFETAAKLAFSDAAKRAKPTLLEPIMSLEVTTPEEFLGTVSSDLTMRRAVIKDSRVRGSYRLVDAEVPLANMFGYATQLRSISQGRANWVMEPSHYALVPDGVSEKILQTLY